MTYIFFIIFFIILGIISFIPKVGKILNKNAFGTHFILTVIATLIGVFTAISISNIEENSKEKQDVIKILTANYETVRGIKNYSTNLKEALKEFPDSVRKNNPFPYPESFDSMLNNDLILRNISSESLNELTNNQINIKRLNSSSPHSQYYISLIGHIAKVLKLKIEFQKGHINLQILNQKIDQLKDPLPIKDSINLDNNIKIYETPSK
ncbi:hypothetical protein UJ101_00012 [Flavobacteriaceae bacterium UJ101]|nr:hypothetical protein UJ101_00012 [Flavobacteriaceae bacterium UJ101]